MIEKNHKILKKSNFGDFFIFWQAKNPKPFQKHKKAYTILENLETIAK